METGGASFAGDLLRCTIAFRYLYSSFDHFATFSRRSLPRMYVAIGALCTGPNVGEEKLGNPLGWKVHYPLYTVFQTYRECASNYKSFTKSTFL